jgi:hypothetical protein
MKKINFLVMLLFLATVSAQAQVTIGGKKIPSPFSILELISGSESNTGNRGLRLPQLTTEERETLEDTDDFQNEKTDKAVGLQIFNTTTRCVETWNGTKWIQSCGEDGARPATGRLAYRNSYSGEINGWIDFMSYNMGATAMSIKEQLLFASSTFTGDPTSHQDALAANFKPVYGDLYQWGRKTDGHQNVWSGISAGPVAVEDWTKEGTSENFTTFGASSIEDWLANDDEPDSEGSHLDRWGGGNGTVKGANDPCPSGFRVPSQDEWAGIVAGRNEYLIFSGNVGYGVNKWVWVDGSANTPLSSLGFAGVSQTAKTSGYLIYPPKVLNPTATDEDYHTTPTLFLPAAGFRYGSGGQLVNAGMYGYYWSTVYETTAYATTFVIGDISPIDYRSRGNGLSVRCLSE